MIIWEKKGGGESRSGSIRWLFLRTWSTIENGGSRGLQWDQLVNLLLFSHIKPEDKKLEVVRHDHCETEGQFTKYDCRIRLFLNMLIPEKFPETSK